MMAVAPNWIGISICRYFCSQIYILKPSAKSVVGAIKVCNFESVVHRTLGKSGVTWQQQIQNGIYKTWINVTTRKTI